MVDVAVSVSAKEITLIEELVVVAAIPQAEGEADTQPMLMVEKMAQAEAASEEGMAVAVAVAVGLLTEAEDEEEGDKVSTRLDRASRKSWTFSKNSCAFSRFSAQRWVSRFLVQRAFLKVRK